MLQSFDPYYTPKEAVEYLRERGFKRITIASLATMRNRCGGPVYETKGRFIVYRQSELDKWIARQSRGPFNSTSDGWPYGPDDFDNGDIELS